MTCKWPNCPNEAEENLYFTINGQKAGFWGEVCAEHSCVSPRELIDVQATIQINAGFSLNDNTADAIDDVSIMTEKL